MDKTKDVEAVPAGRFKQECLALLERVAQSHRPLIITKRGKPIARLIPIETSQEIEAHILAELRSGQGGMLVDEASFLEPTAELAGWDET